MPRLKPAFKRPFSSVMGGGDHGAALPIINRSATQEHLLSSPEKQQLLSLDDEGSYGDLSNAVYSRPGSYSDDDLSLASQYLEPVPGHAIDVMGGGFRLAALPSTPPPQERRPPVSEPPQSSSSSSSSSSASSSASSYSSTKGPHRTHRVRNNRGRPQPFDHTSAGGIKGKLKVGGTQQKARMRSLMSVPDKLKPDRNGNPVKPLHNMHAPNQAANFLAEERDEQPLQPWERLG